MFKHGDRVVDGCGIKGTVVYAGNQTLGNMFPVIVLNDFGVEVSYRTNGTIGALGIPSRLDIVLDTDPVVDKKQKTDAEIDADCAESWNCGGWGFSMDDLIRLSYTRVDGQCENPNDVVWTSEDGTSEFTRGMAAYWFSYWKSYQYGFQQAAKLYNK